MSAAHTPRDLGPLAWVMDELRATLQSAVEAVSSYVKDNDEARATDLAEVDSTALRMLRQQLHQAVGALEMVELSQTALVLRALESATQRMVQKPAVATAEASAQVARGARALIDYLERVVRQRPVSALALFPTYRDWQTLAGADRIHPADLWEGLETLVSVEPPEGKAYQPGPQVRAHLDRLVLHLVKDANRQAAVPLAQLCAGLCRGAGEPAVRQFWLAAAAYFEAASQGLLPADLYVKRVASRVLLQYAALVQGNLQGVAQLTQDLLFFASQAVLPESPAGEVTPCLRLLWQAHGWTSTGVWDYQSPVLGAVDPLLLGRLRDAIATAQRAWASRADSDGSAFIPGAGLSDLAAALRSAHPSSEPLASAWEQVAQSVDAAGAASMAPALALEVANGLLFLNATFEDFDPLDTTLAQRYGELAHRLAGVLAGEPAPEPTSWMAGVYQRLSEQQTLGQVVARLQAERTELESVLDAYFRHPEPPTLQALNGQPERLDVMRGVVVMLGLPAAARALEEVRRQVHELLTRESLPDAGELTQAFAVVAPNLSGLGWLFDTLARQPDLARAQFQFDEATHTLRSQLQPDEPLVITPPAAISAPQDEVESVDGSESAQTPAHEAIENTPQDEDDEGELLDIFLNEAREVFAQAEQALRALRDAPGSLPDLTALRRGFHTLKGSARMVGLADFGEAAWAMEQLLNSWLADQKPATSELLELCTQALEGMTAWVDSLSIGEAGLHDASVFRRSADAMRLEGKYLPLSGDTGQPEPEPEPEPEPPLLDEAVKVVGPLCIDLELYNVFLNEADEWSRRLSQTLAEWALEPDTALPANASPLAHSLAGGSATVGYTGLSSLARAIEHALDRVAAQESALGPGRLLPDDVALLVKASEEARHLLHQFAAGFLREPHPETLELLAHMATAPVPMPAPVPEPEPELDPQPVESPAAPQPLSPESAAVDRLDADLFTVFEDEAQELLPRMASAMRQWIGRPDNTSARAEVLRNLHTFKGSARLAGALRLGDMAHQLETEVLAQPEPLTGGSSQLKPLQVALDSIIERFDDLRATFAAPEHVPAPGVEGIQWQAPEGQVAPVAAAAYQPAPLSPVVPVSVAPQPAVRVRAELLDQLMLQTGDVMLTRNRLENDIRSLRQSFKDMSGNIERLRHQLRDLEIQTETQMQTRLVHSRESETTFDPLEFDRYTRVQELTRLLAESVNDVATVQHHLQRAVEGAEGNLAMQARQTRDLQRDLLRTRLVAFDVLAERLHRVLRQTAELLGKQVHLDIEGAEIEVDRGVLDRLTPALEHLLRNAVVHGVEPEQQRLRSGKPAQGRVNIALKQSGNDLELILVDDGTGLDLTALRAKAEAAGVPLSEGPLSDSDASRCIFAPGVSTAESVTELAGRGIGLDVVRSEVLGLGGRIEYFRPQFGGTGFRILVPLTTAVTQVVLLRVGDFTFGVPAPWVETVRRSHAPELTAAYVSGQWRDGEHLMPFYWAGALLALSVESNDPSAHEARSWPVLEFHSAGQRVAWHVDEVLGHQEVVVKPLGPQLARLPGLAGATVLASGAVALIYNPVALASLYGGAARAWVRAQRAQGTQQGKRTGTAGHGTGQAPLVLVVDDSITVRRVTQRLLKREGYRVALATDGEQALERLHEEMPVVVLCDIEMPRMDGFEFVRHLRTEPRWMDLPVVMITSRLADKHREHAQSMGVDHYLGKPYSEEELLNLVAAYARLAPAAG